MFIQVYVGAEALGTAAAGVRGGHFVWADAFLSVLVKCIVFERICFCCDCRWEVVDASDKCQS